MRNRKKKNGGIKYLYIMSFADSTNLCRHLELNKWAREMFWKYFHVSFYIDSFKITLKDWWLRSSANHPDWVTGVS